MRANIGIYNLHLQTMGGGEKLALALAEHLSLDHNVWLFHVGQVDVNSLEQFFGVDLSRVKIVSLKNPGPLLRVIAKLRGERSAAFSLHHYLQLKHLKLDFFINNSYTSALTCPAARGVFICMFPHPLGPPAASLPNRTRDALVDWVEKCVTGVGVQNFVNSYAEVVAISQYSAEWVFKIWGHSPAIIYPPCDDMGPAAAKQNIILHVGRFIADNGQEERHHKGQDFLLETFKGMTDLHRDGWELHLIGSVGTDVDSAKFAEALVRVAKGYPVTFHFNAPREELRDLYRRAAIYWHATGHGLPTADHPARQEHFGITTVEAMSAGAVPVVKGSGGQTEIVTHGVDGLCWDDAAEFVSGTLELVHDPALRARLSRQAIVSSRRFCSGAFAKGVDHLVEQMLSSNAKQPLSERANSEGD